MKVFYNDNYVAAAETFDTTRKAEHVAGFVSKLAGVDIVDPYTVDTHDGSVLDVPMDDYVERAIRRVHSDEYVDALKTGTPRRLAQSQGFQWDAGLWTAIRASTAGVIAAVDAALGRNEKFSGSLSSGLHHAGYDYGNGFCSVNGLVVAAAHAQLVYGAKVIIVDFDAHCGGGTNNLLTRHKWLDVTHLDLSIIPFDAYEASRPGDVNVERFAHESNDLGYLHVASELLKTMAKVGDDERRPTLVLYNAGMDPYPLVGESALHVRERLVAEAIDSARFAGVFVLAGGYTSSWQLEDLLRAHATTVSEFAVRAGIHDRRWEHTFALERARGNLRRSAEEAGVRLTYREQKAAALAVPTP